MREKIKLFFNKVKIRVKSQQDTVAGILHVKLLKFFACIGPICTYLCLKNQEFSEEAGFKLS